MPPLPSVPNVIKTIIHGTTSAVTQFPWENVLHFAFSGGSPSVSDLAAMGSYILGGWGTHMAAEAPSTTQVTGCELTDLTTPTGSSVAVFGTTAGTRGDDEIPDNVAFLVSYPIARRFRGGHPRSYLMVGGNADFADGSHWSSAFTQEVANHWGAFLSSIVGHTQGSTTISGMVAVSYYSREVNPVPPYRRTTPLVDAISVPGLVAQGQIATQRRRVGKHDTGGFALRHGATAATHASPQLELEVPES